VLGRRLAYAFDDLATAQLLKGVSDATDREQLALVLVPGLPEERQSEGPAIRNAAADGLIVYSLPADDPLVAAARQRGLPMVVVDSPALPGLAADFVGIDDAGAAEAAVHHLLELGHRRIGIISLPLSAAARPGPVAPGEHQQATASVTKSRLEGCGRALGATGIGWAGVPVEQVRVPGEELGRAAAHVLLDRAPDLTALFAFSDQLALGARLAARERGLSVPADLSIAGFDDTARDVEGLTTIHQPLRAKGRIAAERLLGALGAAPPPPATHLLPFRLVVRRSTGPAPGR
jgi:DNA-binding LacI/PurR family transcriptional regulator